MGWESPFDRMMIRQVDAAGRGREKPEEVRALIQDLIEIAPERIKSFFHLGYALGTLDPQLFEDVPTQDDAGPSQWTLFGRLMGAYRKRAHAVVSRIIHEEGGVDLVEDPAMAKAVTQVILRTGFDDGDLDLVFRSLEGLDSSQSDILEEAVLEILRRVERPHDQEDEAGHQELLVRCHQLPGFDALPPNVRAPLHRDIGRIHQHAGRWDEAIAEFENCVEIAGSGHTLASVLHFDLAACFLRVRGVPDLAPTPGREDTERALRHLDEATSDPKFASFNAYFARGILRLESGDTDAGADDLEQALERIQTYRNPLPVTLARIRYYLGVCLISSDRDDQRSRAAQLIEQALERIEPDTAYFDLVHPVLREKSRRAALRHLDSLDWEAIEEPSRFREIAEEYLTLGESERALRAIDEGLSSDSSPSSRLESLMFSLKAYSLLGDKDGSRDTYFQIRELMVESGRYQELEDLLKDESSVGLTLDHLMVKTELVHLYQVMGDRLEDRVALLLELAHISQKRRNPEALAIAADFVHDAHHLDPDGAADDLHAIEELLPGQLPEWMDNEPFEDVVHDCRDVLKRDPRVLVIGGHQTLEDSVPLLDDMAGQFGIEASWSLANYTTPATLIAEIQEKARKGEVDGFILLHWNRQETIRKVREIARARRLPFRVIRYFSFSSLRIALGEVLDKIVEFRAPPEDHSDDRPDEHSEKRPHGNAGQDSGSQDSGFSEEGA